MPGTLLGDEKPRFTCKCLNVRIGLVATNSAAPDPIQDPNFLPVYVGEEGISVTHPQVTVRTRTRGVPIAGTSRFSRYTTITCLLCDLVVYRVYQTYSADIEGKDGPLLPTEDWVERDVMKSLSGWIEVHKDCLTGDVIEQAISSSNYSDIFGLLLPSVVTPPPSPQPILERPLSPSSASPSPPPPKFFADVRPVFLPPPFTPSHPVFTYLSSFAVKESQAIRDAAEDYMSEQMKSKTSEIEKADAELRKKVDALWQRFREGLGRVQPGRKDTSTGARRISSTSRERSTGVNVISTGTPLSIREFIPTGVTRARSSSPPAPRVSALSASLATTSFHHPRARSTATSPPPASARSSSVVSNGSSRSGSSTLGSAAIAVPQSLDASAANILKIRRNINDTADTAASYRFFMTLEEDMERLRGKKVLDKLVPEQAQQAGPSRATGSENINGENRHKETSATPPTTIDKPTRQDDEGQPSEGGSPPRGREKGKGKRKVTFDVKPAVVTIKREVIAEKEEEEALANEDGDMIFDLEDLEGDNQGSPNLSKPTLQLVEQPTAPVRPRKPRPPNTDNLSSSFSGLRPTSLPAPSHVRPPRSQHGSDLSSSSMMISLSKPVLLSQKNDQASTENGDDSDHPTQDAEILKLVAANTPSHRGAWKPTGKAWQNFTRRQSESQETSAIPEEIEDDGTDASGFALPDIAPSRRKEPEIADMFVGSLPIPIKLGKQKETLSLASYQAKTLTAQAAPAPPVIHQKQPSSNAIRKAVYAERDRTRSLDPGPLDFRTEDDDEEHEKVKATETGEVPVDTASPGGRSRQAALKILKARSEIPEAGMWRSLAS
ncbi:hypothetical protein H0H81_005882 [Sphagnurus paluster]|uniref:Uncharacterized protein n=1 Tax=Sphagnurus paluster TaxID=117069 RepID=A0A9P7FWL0_9AGAR|nr:hypothetical protein H0H81_005882 [Sphagnurus paluster]